LNGNSFPLFTISRGQAVEAKYIDPLLDDYRGNPLIEALPPIMNEGEAVRQLASKPNYQPSERNLPVHLRMHCVQRIGRDFFQPLSRHVELEQKLSRLIRDGYVGRNPLTPNYAFRSRRDAYDLIVSGKTEGFPVNNPTSSGFALVGISGIGKSSSILRILSLYPQVIVHSKYKETDLNLYQIVWLKMDCPHDGSIRGLCLNFFHAVDSLVGTQYYRKHASGRKTVDELLPIMAQVAAVHCIGVLVIDEIQNLIEAKIGTASKMLNFFVQLVNTIGLPVILVGTHKATPVLNGEFRNARRGTGQGDDIWERMKNDEEWHWLLQGLWKFQWTEEQAELTPQFVDVMYQESQGITDIAIKLFMLAQWRALDQQSPCITPDHIVSVARDRLQLLQPALSALRSGDRNKIAAFGDIYSSLNVDEILSELVTKHKQEERLELIRRELKVDPSEEIRLDIQRWLEKAGIESELAIKAAKEVVLQYLDRLQEVDIYQEGLKAAIRLQKEDVQIKKTRRQNAHKNKHEIFELDDLRFIVRQSKTLQISAYETLKKAGYIKDASEFVS
jgi:hypothetical protein